MPTLDELRARTERIGVEYRDVRDRAAELYRELAPMVVELAKADVPQGEIVELAKVSRQTVRSIEKKAGIVRRMSTTWANGESS